MAHFALVRLDAIMRSNVDLEAPRPRIGFRAVRALVRQFARVDELVGLEVAARNELFTAIGVLANEGPLPRLYTGLINQKLTWILKCVFKFPVSTN
jgi:hypothetical protein